MGRPKTVLPLLYPDTLSESSVRDVSPKAMMDVCGRLGKNTRPKRVNVSSILKCFKETLIRFQSLDNQELSVTITKEERSTSPVLSQRRVPRSQRKTQQRMGDTMDSKETFNFRGNVIFFRFSPPEEFKGRSCLFTVDVKDMLQFQFVVNYVCPTSESRFFKNPAWYAEQKVLLFYVDHSIQTKAAIVNPQDIEKFHLPKGMLGEFHTTDDNDGEENIPLCPWSPSSPSFYDLLENILDTDGKSITFFHKEESTSQAAENREIDRIQDFEDTHKVDGNINSAKGEYFDATKDTFCNPDNGWDLTPMIRGIGFTFHQPCSSLTFGSLRHHESLPLQNQRYLSEYQSVSDFLQSAN